MPCRHASGAWQTVRWWCASSESSGSPSRQGEVGRLQGMLDLTKELTASIPHSNFVGREVDWTRKTASCLSMARLVEKRTRVPLILRLSEPGPSWCRLGKLFCLIVNSSISSFYPRARLRRPGGRVRRKRRCVVMGDKKSMEPSCFPGVTVRRKQCCAAD